MSRADRNGKSLRTHIESGINKPSEMVLSTTPFHLVEEVRRKTNNSGKLYP